MTTETEKSYKITTLYNCDLCGKYFDAHIKCLWHLKDNHRYVPPIALEEISVSQKRIKLTWN